jgi:hypothetical protein
VRLPAVRGLTCINQTKELGPFHWGSSLAPARLTDGAVIDFLGRDWEQTWGSSA